MIEFLSLKPSTFGLDFSDLSLKIVKLKKRRKFLRLASWGETKIKPGIIEEGEIKDENGLIEAIKKGLKEVKGEKLKTKNVIASLPENKAFLQVIQVPKMTQDELKTAVPFEAENYIPLPFEEVYFDFQVVLPVYPVRDYKSRIKGQREQISNGVYNHLDHVDILIAAFPKKTVYPYFYCLKKAGLIPQGLEIESQSISRALIKNGVSSFPVLIIDFGRSRASFIIFSGSSLRFTSSIPISSHELTETIARTLRIDLPEAEKLKLKYGLPRTIFQDNGLGKQNTQKMVRGLETSRRITKNKKIFKAIIPILTNLVGQIKKYIDYYQTHASHEHLPPNGKGIEKVLLCGRGANLLGLTDFLSAELKIPVELGNPWVNILPQSLKEVPELPFEESLGYTTALGLALRGIDIRY